VASYLSLTSPRSFLLQEIYNYNFKKTWFSDPSTYPIICVMCTATAVVVGMGINALRYKNVKFNPAIKHDTIVQDVSGKRTTVTEILARNPVGFHRASLKNIRYEGLGVDHEEWKKAKAELSN
jgi:hypothetical protein